MYLCRPEQRKHATFLCYSHSGDGSLKEWFSYHFGFVIFGGYFRLQIKHIAGLL